MNKRRKLYRITAVMMCLILMVGFGTGFSAKAETTVYTAMGQQELLWAIDKAKDGDTILIGGNISMCDFGDPEKQVILERMTAETTISLQYGANVQNIVFDGKDIKTNIPMVTIQGDFTIENCTFQNCNNKRNDGGGIGGAVQVKSGTGNFNNCNFNQNSAIAGGHIAVMSNTNVTFKQCDMKNGYGYSKGGAILIAKNSICNIDSCIIRNNKAEGNYGGGVANDGHTEIKNSKIYDNTTLYGGADVGTSIGATTELKDSVEQLNELFTEDNIIVNGWVCDYDFEEGIYIPDIDPNIENSLLKLDYEYKQPEPEEPEPTDPEQPTEPGETEPTEPDENNSSPDDGEDKEPEMPDDKEPDTTPDEGPGDNTDKTPETPPSSTVDNSTTNTTTDNSNTNTSSNSSTDNSTSSIDNSDRSNTTDNSRRTTTSDSNNTSTVNNYYTEEKQPSGNSESVQTIVVPVGNAGSGEPINQTIRIEGNQPEGQNSGNADGMTLNINVNVGSEETKQPIPQAAASTDNTNDFTWYQVMVLCLLSGILVCLIKRR